MDVVMGRIETEKVGDKSHIKTIDAIPRLDRGIHWSSQQANIVAGPVASPQ